MPKNRIIPYNPELKHRARELRKNATKTERILWREIRGKKLGIEFHRQVPIDQYIVDFYCHELMLAIELDGITHASEQAVAKDSKRQQRIEALGVSFLRFYDNEVTNHLEAVLLKIKHWIDRSVASP